MQQGTNLEKLRVWMAANKVEAIHVPREDMFGGEYVAACDERLAWVSGFTGSAGFAIITHDAAHLFVDGRYTLQAKKQAPDFKIHDFNKAAIDSVCNSLSTLHYDPWLMSAQQLQSWRDRADLIALKANPIDALWTNRPKPIHKAAFDYPVIYAGTTREEKRKLIQTPWFLSNPESVCWLLNIRGGDLPYVPLLHCMALITRNEITLFCEPSKISTELATYLNVKVMPFEQMVNTLKAVDVEMYADKRTTPSALNDISFNWQTDPCELPKAKKNLTEQQGMRNCHMRDAVSVIRFWMWLENQKDITEIDAQDYLETCRQKMDSYQGASFATISGFGAHGAIVHYRAEPNTNVAITQGMYLLDSGGQYLDGTTDITRTFSIGVPTQEQRIHYTLVLKGHIALANASFPIGTTGAQLDALARQHLWNNGLDYAHGTGHGVGSYLNVHEGPQGISKVRNTVLEPGMVVSNEPGLYLERQYGIRIENLQIVKESAHEGFLCFESLTLVPYDSSLIEKSLLTQPELGWLKCYYQSILTNVSPMLNDGENNWLKQKIF
ncbi:MAG: aminopeptidase P family protein [Alphaproteobacteria bacterium]